MSSSAFTRGACPLVMEGARTRARLAMSARAGTTEKLSVPAL